MYMLIEKLGKMLNTEMTTDEKENKPGTVQKVKSPMH